MDVMEASEVVIAQAAMVAAACIVLLTWLVTAALVLLYANRRVQRLEAQSSASAGPPSASPGADMHLLFYALSVFFWPAALILGVYLLREPASARAGRICIVIGLAVLTLIVALTCAGMVVLAFVAPDLLG